MTSPMSSLPSRRLTWSGFGKLPADFSGNESAGTCTTWASAGLLQQARVWATGRGMKLVVVGWAVYGRQTVLLAQGSCSHTERDRVASGFLGSGLAWFLVGSSMLLRPHLLLALWEDHLGLTHPRLQD